MSNYSVIFVTNNSEKFISKAMSCVENQTLPPSKIVIIDSGSSNYGYLEVYRKNPRVTIHIGDKGIGFCKGNNIGMDFIHPDSEYILFLNPDAFLTPHFIEQAIHIMNTKPEVGILTGILLGYDISQDKPTGKIDSAGIFRTWYGKWYDRAQGIEQHFYKHEEVPAICGALMFCRKKALDETYLRENEVFDNTFYMYKEDIDLSLRLRKKGWKMLFTPELEAYHCRGWKRNRKEMPRLFRLCSAKNEWRINFRSKRLIPLLYSTMKYCLVRFGNI